MPRMGTKVAAMDTSEALARQIAIEVRDAMSAAGISQRDMASRSGIPLVTLSRRLVGGHKPFDLAEVAVVAGVMGLSLTELVLRAERNLPKAVAA